MYCISTTVLNRIVHAQKRRYLKETLTTSPIAQIPEGAERKGKDEYSSQRYKPMNLKEGLKSASHEEITVHTFYVFVSIYLLVSYKDVNNFEIYF